MFHVSTRRFVVSTPLSKCFYSNILVTEPAPKVQLIQLNRPKALNALSSPTMKEVNEALFKGDADPNVKAFVITGSEKAFAAGADIKEMQVKEFADVVKEDFLHFWADITTIKKPIIAAVSGDMVAFWNTSLGPGDLYRIAHQTKSLTHPQLGGGCELAMMCDIIYASKTAKFGQPEINLGVIPGAGGTQRFTHALGKSLAMELVLTGRMIDATEAERKRLVSKVVDGDVVEEAVKLASEIASKGQITAQSAKEAVNSAYDLSLKEGLRFERRLFHQLFATEDQTIGMTAFVEKKKAEFVDK